VTNQCKDPKAKVLVELEPAAVWALLNDDYRALKSWALWELPHHARGPLRLASSSSPDTTHHGLHVYRVTMRCEQAEALRDRSDELADILEDMPEQADRDAGAALERAEHAFNEAIRLSLPE